MNAMTAEEFDSFYAGCFDRVVHTVHALSGSHTLAVECVQDAFVVAWARRGALDEGGSPEAWVRSQAYLRAATRRRRRRTTAALDPELDALQRALALLPETERHVVVLHELCDLPLAEIAFEYGITRSAAEAELADGRATLRRALPAGAADPFAPLRTHAAIPRVPPEEVRRRGDVRRQTQGAFVAGVLALVVVALVATLNGALGRPEEELALDPQESWILTVPLGFPVQLADPEVEWVATRGQPLPLLGLSCSGLDYWSDNQTDILGVQGEDASKAQWSSQVATYRNPDSAQRVLDALADQAEACLADGDATGWTYGSTRADLGVGGTRSVLVAGGPVDGNGQRLPGRWQLHAVQAGNAVLVTQVRDGSVAPILELSEATAAQLLADTRRLAPNLCVFELRPCDGTTGR